MKTLLILSLLISSCAPGYSDGDRVGVVYKLSHKGLIWKSWEGEMTLRMSADENGVVAPVIWNFHVPEGSPDVALLQDAMMNHSITRIHYSQWAIGPLTQDADYDVTRVDVKKEAQ